VNGTPTIYLGSPEFKFSLVVWLPIFVASLCLSMHMTRVSAIQSQPFSKNYVSELLIASLNKRQVNNMRNLREGFCNVWVCVCVVVLVICLQIRPYYHMCTCIYCVLYCFVYVYLFSLCYCLIL